MKSLDQFAESLIVFGLCVRVYAVCYHIAYCMQLIVSIWQSVKALIKIFQECAHSSKKNLESYWIITLK